MFDPQPLGLSTQDAVLPFTTDDLTEFTTPQLADLADKAAPTQKSTAILDHLLANDMSMEDAYRAANTPQDLALSTQDSTTPPQDLALSTQDFANPFNALTNAAQALAPETQDPRPFPHYTAPTLSPLQAGLIGLGAVLDPHHAAQDVQGGLQGNTEFHNALYQRAVQEHINEMHDRQDQIKNILTLAGMQNGRDEAQARLDAASIWKEMQLQMMAQYRNAVLADRVQNHLQNQYERASGLDQKLDLGRKLGYSDDMIVRDWRAQQPNNSDAAKSAGSRQQPAAPNPKFPLQHLGLDTQDLNIGPFIPNPFSTQPVNPLKGPIGRITDR